MKKTVFITAVSGSGKSTVCKALRELGYEAYDIESIPGLYTLVDEKTGKQIPGKNIGDLARNTDGEWVCDLEKLKSIIAGQQSEIAFYCGGTSRTEEMMAEFDHTVILRVSDETTLTRLSTRSADEFGGTEDVRKWVLSWKHRVETDWLAAGGISIDAEPEPIVVAQSVVERFTKP